MGNKKDGRKILTKNQKKKNNATNIKYKYKEI